MRIITLFSLAVLFMSCDCYIAQPTSIPVATPNRFLIIFNGESNSGGLVYDSLLSPSELAPQSQIQILNNTSFHFESLDIGTNNNLDHFNMPVGRHGWEANLANKVLSESSYYGDSVFLVKTGQGGSMLSEWDVNGIYFQKFKKRLDTAQYKLRDRNLKKVIFLSIGLNDTTICFFVPFPLRRIFSWLKSASNVSDASSIHISVSSPLANVIDFSFSVSSKPLNTALLPFKHVTRRSDSFTLKSCCNPHFDMICLNSAKVESLFVFPTDLVTSTFAIGLFIIFRMYLSAMK